MQALNSNDAESPSGTFRSHMNNMVPEKGAGSQHAAKPIAICRPVAQVRPLQLTQTSEAENVQIPNNNGNTKAMQHYGKRNFRLKLGRCLRSVQRKKSMQNCCICGVGIVVRMRVGYKKCLKTKCSKCRKAMLMNKLIKEIKSQVEVIEKSVPEKIQIQSEKQFLKRPLIDGKVVSSLRRLGTTLSRDISQENSNSCKQKQLPHIMSPVKQKPLFTRQLEEDEILFDFNTAISEVLPNIVKAMDNIENSEEKKFAARCLKFEECSNNNKTTQVKFAGERQESHIATTSETIPLEMQHIYHLIPKGLSISLI